MDRKFLMEQCRCNQIAEVKKKKKRNIAYTTCLKWE